MRSAIRTALETRLATASGIPAGTQWAKENAAFSPTIGTPWVRVTHGWGPRQRLTMPANGAWRRWSGLFLIDLFRPLEEGTSTADGVADAVLGVFPAGLLLPLTGGGTIRITTAGMQLGQRDTAWHQVPLTVGWELFDTQTL